jgi:hypothetical protein
VTMWPSPADCCRHIEANEDAFGRVGDDEPFDTKYVRKTHEEEIAPATCQCCVE